MLKRKQKKIQQQKNDSTIECCICSENFCFNFIVRYSFLFHNKLLLVKYCANFIENYVIIFTFFFVLIFFFFLFLFFFFFYFFRYHVLVILKCILGSPRHGT